ncbi:unnamed protein product [Thlaspi arvense]|uniref:Uncharacterized protein n=1 Tax=Thlaspi arvense TaxID=13288 RepID=A0AAU9RYS4_THLAR|nr:unnamed protein product [Thlaspi arvense]
MVRAVEQEPESYRSRLFDFEKTKEKNSSPSHVKIRNSDSALRSEDPDIDDETVFKKNAASSVRTMLRLRPPLAKDEPPQPCEATDEELQEKTGKGDNILYSCSNLSLRLVSHLEGYCVAR